ncbi:MAG: tetratricopeptide repeat protein [Acidobacteriota bacterium]|nr:tetratricopeptide repeat protein [Acidobacteriota bacterium]
MHSILGSCVRFLLLLVVVQAVALGQSGQQQVVVEVTSALRQRDFDGALKTLESALQVSPGNPQLRVLQGIAYSGKGDKKNALASYRRALKDAPDYLPALEGAAQLEYEAGSADAIPLLEHVLRLRPNDSTAHAMLAATAAKSGDCATAVKHFAESGEMLERQPDALRVYGVCLLKLKEDDKAVGVFQELVAAAPDDARARRDLAAVQLSAGHSQDALATLKPLLDGDTEVDTLHLAADVYEANQDTPNAVKCLRAAIVKDPKQIPLYVDFAEIAMNHQSFQAGVTMLDAGLKLQPNAAQLYLARGVLYVQMAQYDKAEADFAKAEQLDPSQGMSAAAQGMLAEEKNQDNPDKALARVRAELAREPNDAFLWYLQAAIISQKSPEPSSTEFAAGIRSAKHAVELQPSLTAAHNVLAKYYLDSGENALAAKECRLALEGSPSDQTALYHLVQALRKTGKTDEIPELLKRLAKARQDAAREEGERNRYKLVVNPAGAAN